MAESVARVKILAQIEGLEGFDKLKGAFRGLQQAIGPAESELAKARKQILAFGEAGAKSEQLIKGQVEALKALRSQATIGGNVYRQLGKDVKTLGSAYKEAATGVKEFTDAQLKSQIVGAKPSTFGKQVAALKRDLQDLSVYSQQYTDKLTEIQRRQLPFNTALGRQGVIAAAEAYSQGGKGGSALPALPDTTAALNQRMTELGAELVNVTRGGEAWIRVSREMAAVQRELNREFANPAVEAAQRRLEQSRNITSGFLQFSTGLEDRIAVQRSIDRNQRKREAEAAARSGPMQGPPAPSELFQGIAGISNQTAANQLQLMGRSYREVADSIRQTAGASDGSLGSLQRQRAAWEQLRATISPLDKEYAQIEREARRAIAAADRQIGRRQIGGRGGAGQIGQGTGALAASGIFGGPEGFLGSAIGGGIGALVGGPAGFATGTFLGGSVGAYAGMGRQALGGFSTYAADISKLEIALKGVAKTQEEYQRALAASASVTRDFNVPQLEATRGMTQLSAAVIGAGGKVADAEVVFRNVTAAIKASGGTSEDVQGALTALGQIFSKGKVSAEELQGQLGERLPGAVTMFAKATGRTLPQLQKDLEQGVVGLADLMKFVVSEQGLGQFEQRAKAVASSSADAGARLTATWNNTKRAIGEAILPLGAQIQDSLGKALKDATPALVEFAQGLAGFVKLLVDNAGLIASVTKAFLELTVVVGTGFAFAKAAAGFAAITSAVSQLGGAMAVARLAAQTLGASLFAIPGIGWIGTAVAGLALLTKAVYDNNDTFKSWVDNIGGVIANDFKAAIDGMKKDAKSAFKDIGDLLPDYEKQNKTTQANTEAGWADTFRAIRDNAVGFVSDIQKAFSGLFDQLPPWARKILIDNAGGTGVGLAARVGNYVAGASQRAASGQGKTAQESGMYGRYAAPEQQQTIKQSSTGLTDFTQPPGADAKERTAEKARQDAERLAAEQQRLNEATAKAQIEYARTVFNNQMELIRKRWDYEDQRLKMQRDLQAGALTGIRAEQARAANEFLAQREAIRRQVREATLDVVRAERTAEFNSRMEAVTSQGLGEGKQRGQIVEYLTGDRSHPGYRADHGGGNYHEHVAFKTAEQMRAAMEALKASGVKIGSTTGGRHAAGSYHYSGQAFDVPASQVPVGQEQALSRRVREVLANAGFAGMGIGGGSQAIRNVAAQGKLGSASAEAQQAGVIQGLTRKQGEDTLSLMGAKFVQERTQAMREEIAQMERGNQLALERVKLEQSGMRPELVEAALKSEQLRLDYLERQAQIRADIASAEAAGDKGAAEYFNEQLAESTTHYERQLELVNALAQAQTAQGVALANYVGQLRLQLAEMTNIENVLISVGQTIETEVSSAMSTAVSAVITGSGSVKQTLAEMFNNIGQSFVKMATDIIAKQMIMIVLQSVLKALGGGMFGGGGGGNAATALGSNPNVAAYAPLADGGVFGGGIQPFAKGGVVSRPTFFKFANGGTMQNGVMGEAGPEAIVPLKRGFDGKLGIAQVPAAQGGDNRMRQMMGASPAAVQQPVLNMKFESTSINGVEYVSREQLEQAMAQTRRQASKDGARQGMSMTLDRLQQSPSTRSRVGIR